MRRNAQKGDSSSSVDQSIGAGATLELFEFLRRVLIQDSVILRKRWPHLTIWQDPIFERQDYIEYAHDLEVAQARVEIQQPSLAQLHQSALEYLDRAQSHSDQRFRMNALHSDPAGNEKQVETIEIGVGRVQKLLRWDEG